MKGLDPRDAIISERLGGIKKIIAVSGGKGGTGKSSVASMLALALSESGQRTGLLDLDFCGPSDHVILGIHGGFPEEKNGIIPPEFDGIRFMSITYYTNEEPAPLRGIDISNAITELLAITQWGELDFLIIDMPPGLGDEVMDVIRLMHNVNFLLVSGQSRVITETVRKTAKILHELKIPFIGVIENMHRHDMQSSGIEGAAFLGKISFDPSFEDSIGDTARLKESGFFRDIISILPMIL
jgi:ATP-binding protein involved in chromosome partitioning